jgi:hypothetical protein
MRCTLVIALAGWAVLAQAGVSHAGLYQKDVLADFDIDADSNAVPLSFDSFMIVLGNVLQPDNPETPAYKEIVQAIKERNKKAIGKETEKLTADEINQLVGKLTTDELVAQSAELLRLRRLDERRNEAVDLLSRKYQEVLRHQEKKEPLTGMILMHQAFAHHLQKDFARAVDLEDSALSDYGFPKSMMGLTDQQLEWYKRLERDYYLPFLRQRRNEAIARKASVRDGLDPIFPTAAKRKQSPVQFVGESGKFEAGTIAAAEKAKLPKDAIAVVQQLVLWDPDDNRLLWQLAELYNAAGNMRAANALMDLCVNAPRQYTNPELLDHRRTIQTALPEWLKLEAKKQEELERRRKVEEERAEAEATRIREERRAEDEKARSIEEASKQDAAERKQWVRIGVATVLVFVVYWQVREVLRRWQKYRATGPK